MLTAVLLAIAAFAATNVDNLFVLLAFFAEARDAWRPVVVGQYIGSMALVALACVIAALMVQVPRAYVGLIGVMPILIGIGKAFELFRRANGTSADRVETQAGTDGSTDAEADADRVEKAGVSGADANRPAVRAGSSIWTVATVAIANGSDNLSVYVPLFAARPVSEGTAIVVVFVVMVALWCVLAKWLVSHRLIGKPISRYAHLVLPWVLMFIGASVIVGNGTLRALGL
ncbi:Cadmium transporter [Pararobbsia alpina]|uniref:cadmium resistance transporter n=1 Tax=Pararobbsia alpina TaxID=621374 RepID=UPI0039A56048